MNIYLKIMNFINRTNSVPGAAIRFLVLVILSFAAAVALLAWSLKGSIPQNAPWWLMIVHYLAFELGLVLTILIGYGTRHIYVVRHRNKCPEDLEDESFEYDED